MAALQEGLVSSKELPVIPEEPSTDVENSESMTAERRDNTEEQDVADNSMSKSTKWRNIIGFLILGFCTDFPYVIMLSAALDIIKHLDDPGNHGNSTTNSTQCTRLPDGSYPGRQRCEIEGTSVILLADILPTFIMKFIAPYFMNFIPYWIRVLFSSSFCLASFILVGLSINKALVIFGVVCASIGSGFGELTFLSLTARYDKSTISGWSSGTGFASIGGALIYAGLRVFLSPSVTLYLQTGVPVLMMLTFIFVLGKPGKIVPSERHINDNININSNDFKVEEDKPLLAVKQITDTKKRTKLKLFNKEELSYWWGHVKYVPRLWKYMLPLLVVYMAEYAINQSLFEQLYNPGTLIAGKKCLTQDDQYRWLQVTYQIGVVISRSSLWLVRIEHFWILSLLQVINFFFFFFAACYLFIPSFWITCILGIYEGLLGGGVYVNAFYSISKDVPKIHREFSMGVASVADSSGIFTAAVLSEWVIHKYICDKFAHYVEYY